MEKWKKLKIFLGISFITLSYKLLKYFIVLFAIIKMAPFKNHGGCAVCGRGDKPCNVGDKTCIPPQNLGLRSGASRTYTAPKIKPRINPSLRGYPEDIRKQIIKLANLLPTIPASVPLNFVPPEQPPQLLFVATVPLLPQLSANNVDDVLAGL